MKILHVSAECYPIAKVGGLADVVGALPKYLTKLNHKAKVIMPFYDTKFTKSHKFEILYQDAFKLGDKNIKFKIKVAKSKNLGFELYLVDIPELFNRGNLYSYEDDTERFLAFQIAVLNWVVKSKANLDIVHCHDHHSGLIPFMMKYSYEYKTLQETPTIITIHNGQYQGHFGFDKLNLIPEFDLKNTGLLDWYGSINPLATAIKCAWKVTTVSPSYLEEIQIKANGLEGLLRSEREKSIGILNGIDFQVWNPETDAMILKKFGTSNTQIGKRANKKELCKQFNLDPKLPLFAFIGRLVGEKGADLFPQIFNKSLLENTQKINILLLGSGNRDVEKELSELKTKFKGNYNVFIGYDEKLSHLIYAGADFLLMPSRVEPCGLNQMYSMRYGTIPIVRRTGGLKDTVIDIGDNGFGICHNQCSVMDVTDSINRAIELYANQPKFRKIRKKIMSIDHSWENSAKNYINLYKSLI